MRAKHRLVKMYLDLLEEEEELEQEDKEPKMIQMKLDKYFNVSINNKF